MRKASSRNMKLLDLEKRRSDAHLRSSRGREGHGPSWSLRGFPSRKQRQ
jgi:hypothetical protein